MRGVWAILGLALVGCSGFVGVSAPSSGGDARALDVSDEEPGDARAQDAADERGATEELPALLCGAVDALCDPFTDQGCAAGQRCLVTSLLPPTFACGAAGPRRLRESCDAANPASACRAGLQCLSGLCLPLCCAGDHARCGAFSALSRCAVVTDSAVLRGCTVPGECAYAPTDTCAPGTQCFPQSEFGEGVCRPTGSVARDGRCTGQNDCAAGMTCLGGATSLGLCRPVCDPSGPVRCEQGSCALLRDRPLDYGACSR